MISIQCNIENCLVTRIVVRRWFGATTKNECILGAGKKIGSSLYQVRAGKKIGSLLNQICAGKKIGSSSYQVFFQIMLDFRFINNQQMAGYFQIIPGSPFKSGLKYAALLHKYANFKV